MSARCVAVALLWTTAASLMGSVRAQLPQSEVDALLALYNTCGGLNWVNRTNWDATNLAACSGSFGVTCDANKTTVTMLRLSVNGLTGVLPSALTALTNLTVFDVAENSLTGALPSWFSAWSKLVELRLGYKLVANHDIDWWFAMPPPTGPDPKDVVVWISYVPTTINLFSGSLPPEWGALTNLRYLYLERLTLSGVIPREWQNMTMMEKFRSLNNGLSGSLPEWLPMWNRLRVFCLAGSPFTGPVPSTWANISSSLAEFVLNDMTTIDPWVFPSWMKFPYLRSLSLQSMPMSGQLPDSLATDCPLLNVIAITYCSLTGTVPPSLGNLKLFVLSLANNRLTGTIPRELGLPRASTPMVPPVLSNFGLANNMLTGTIPKEVMLPTLQMFALTVNNLTGTIPIEIGNIGTHPSVAATRIILGGNPLTGTVPPHINNATKLAMLRLDATLLTGQFPSMSNLDSLTELHVEGSDFTGDLSFVCGMATLQKLFASGNRFSSFPPCAASLPLPTALTAVDLSLNELTAMPVALSALVNLDSLLLNRNQMVGVVPSGYQGLAKLRSIDISDNPLGTTANANMLPLRRLALLESVKMNNCGLTGSIASEVFWTSAAAFFQAMTTLQWRGNAITGPIPFGLTYCPFLKYVDISDNSFVGPISDYLNVITSLYTEGNPGLSGTLPYWVAPSQSFVRDTPSSPYSCPIFKGATSSAVGFSVDPSYYGYSLCRCDEGTYGSAPNCVTIPISAEVVFTASGDGGELTSDNGTELVISDGAYGNQRKANGIDTSWEIVPNTTATVATSSIDSDSDSDLLHPPTVRYIDIAFVFNRDFFIDFTDIISVYEGGADLKGRRVMVMRGTDEFPDTDGDNDADTITVRVYNSMATVSFRSQDKYGDHFSATVSYSTHCPEGMLASPRTSQCVKVYVVTTDVVNAVRSVSITVSILIAVTIVWVSICRKYLLIQSASYPFLLIMLLALLALAIGGIFWGLSPENGDYVCHLRPWLTAVPLVIFIGAILVKTNRIRVIFNMKKLQSVRITNDQLFLAALGITGGELIFMMIFSGLGLSVSKVIVGAGTTEGMLIHTCTTGPAYDAWLIVNSLYILINCIVAVVFAFQTRAVPAAFNEAGHITAAMYALVFLIIVLAPLQALVGSDPSVAALTLGVGQSFGALTLTAVMFGPKVYMLAIGRGNDQSLCSVDGARTVRTVMSRASQRDNEESNKHVTTTPKQTERSVNKTPKGANKYKSLSTANSREATTTTGGGVGLLFSTTNPPTPGNNPPRGSRISPAGSASTVPPRPPSTEPLIANTRSPSSAPRTTHNNNSSQSWKLNGPLTNGTASLPATSPAAVPLEDRIITIEAP